MRTLNPVHWCTALLALALVSCDNQKEAGPNRHEPKAMADTAYKRYSVRHATIHYESTGHMRGTEDLYITDWGRKEARYSNMEMLQPDGVHPQQTVTVSNGSMITMADITRNGGNRFREPFVDSLIQLENPASPEETSVKVMTDMKYTHKGTDTVLGKTTEVWHDARTGTTLWLWGGVMLRQAVDNPMQKHLVTAVSIDTVSPIDNSKFIPPANIKYSDMPPGPPRGK